MMAVRGLGGSQPRPFKQDAGEHRAGGIGREQHAVGHAGIAVTEVLGEAGHLRVVGVADKERREAGEQASSRR